ncbi:phage fiber-tail adaptor protein [Acetobacter fallax]|uniref:Uncharacterized protein n=1 Tax=Acetobacter fallax TaxID=1737473 RepID=A0ABX0KBW9_9PROT|nr:hypothetical protein [Acetobacter fallax]NHO33939.1 hypothetical protein [Acetobacter fallax]NHO37474.1 hypothetical protein [Acetobacter fallax]
MTTAALPNSLIPSPLRIYTVPGIPPAQSGCCSPIPTAQRGVTTTTGFIPELPAKSSAAILDYSVDFTNWLVDTGDTITSGGVSAAVKTAGGFSYDLAVVWAEPYNGTQAVVMLTSGPAGTFQIVNVQAETEQGRTCTQQIIVPISRTTETVDPAPTSTTTGSGETSPDATGGT